MTAEDLVDGAHARITIYDLMGCVFRAEPSPEFLRRLRSAEMTEAWGELGLALDRRFFTLDEEVLREELAIEYTRLFLGPGPHISPHESVYVEVDGDAGGHWGARTVDVKKFVEATGIAYDDGFTGMPDHFSVELELMKKLIEWEAERRLNGDMANVRYSLKIQKRFMAEHLMAWGPKFCGDVAAATDQSFYREMASACLDFLTEDLDLISAQLLELDQRIA